MTVRAFTPAGLGRDPDAPARLALGADSLVELDDEESRYLIKVRRLRVGDPLDLLDGAGGIWAARLRGLRGRRALVEVGRASATIEPPARVLLLGLPDAAAALDALTGASELGASEVVLVGCARSQGRVPSRDRIARVLRAAQRQCGRPWPLAVVTGPGTEPLGLADALARRAELPGVFAWEALRDPTASAPALPSPAAGLRLLVGPEGGLTLAEVEAIEAAGFVGVSLGPWILRTPTAVVALLGRFVPRPAPA